VAREGLFTKLWKMGSGFLAVDGGRRVLDSNDPSERVVGVMELVWGIVMYKLTE